MIVYFNETQYGKYGWNDVFLELVIHLKNKCGAEIVHHKGQNHEGTHFLIERFDYNLPDCELLIYDEVNDILKGISFADNPGNILDKLFTGRNKSDDILLMSQFHNRFPKDFDITTLDHNFNLKQGTWYTFQGSTNYDHYYSQRMFHNNDQLIDKMFFMGSDYRPDIHELRKLGACNDFIGNIPQLEYMGHAIKYKLGLAIPGVGEICYRDFEYLAMGVPMIRLEYITQLNPPLIPNYHYIAVERDKNDLQWNCHMDQRGGESYVKAYNERFLEVKDDKPLLDFVSKNGRDYYFKYSHPVNRINHLLNILELWEK